tara:strand:+ start:72 stop:497 length:426 start_codon:yes stop_codon:yes gene_type:complete
MFPAQILAEKTGQEQLQQGVYGQFDALTGQGGANLGTAIDPRQAITSYVQTLLQTASVLCILLIVYSGYMLFIARGDESKVDNAKKTLRYTIVGLCIILASYSITLIASRIIDASVQGEDYRREEAHIRFEGLTPTEVQIR